jgi:putative SOS response-associated peptidase YedK
MCGRVRLSSDYSEIKIRLQFAPDSVPPNFEASWNKPPTEPMLVAIRSKDGKRIPKMMRWGLLPHWAKDEKISFSTFNARSEDFRTKPAFRDAWRWGQRCLVVTDGFYVVMAGLWARWRNPKSGNEVLNCTLISDNNGPDLGGFGRWGWDRGRAHIVSPSFFRE